MDSVFVLSRRHSIWRVMLDGVFFGDFRSKSNALECVEDTRRAFAPGRTSRIDIIEPTA
ncbi:hypothetical protein [Terricaulis sp.]|jgi:hypothetical protein|uniref:hypothetical protein n=1 Tax=Terricaulis sp. TaxID=2768686 RepID=UPI002AC65366|nr:hypothetical protein [Terricaulis sp.]MDZ4691679.1 hypothetical protein [Terricaulis sp.]